MLAEDGTTSFQALQNRIGAGRDGALRYYAFDLLYLNGYDVRSLTLLQRKRILRDFMQGHAGDRLVYGEHLVGDGPTIFRQACQLGVEGIVSKRINKRYVQGRVDFWLKTKCLHSREFLIGGFTPPTASRKGLGAILLGAPDEDGGLQFVGKVGTGFTMATLVSLREQLESRRIQESPFANLDRRAADKGTVWVDPELVAEIEYGGWTDDGVLRFGSFKGLRDDVTPAEIEFTMPDSSPSTDVAETHDESREITVDPALVELPPELATLKLTHPDRVVYPEKGITKLGLATYYAQVSHRMLPHIAGRPLSLLRCPGGVNEECFFQKRPPLGLHDAVERIELEGRKGAGTYLVVHDVVGLLALVQFGVLEFHVAGARAERYERPDRIVFDLDPDESLPWPYTTRAAFDLRDWLAAAGLVSFVKTTGGKGLHLMVPIRRRHGWDEVRKFSRKLATLFESQNPRYYTTNPSKAARRGKILIDVMRNVRGATTVAAFSTRAKPQAPVSVPISWDELADIGGSDSMSLQAVMRRLAPHLEDPWNEMSRIDQGLSKRVWACF
jgi:bifunctional non-homologous end joining protein LigD